MHILVWVLKMIGILLLILLGIALALLLGILFIPVRYAVRGEKEAEGDLKMRVTLGWLLHVISFTWDYDEKVLWRLRVFGIPVRKGGGETKTESKTPGKEKKPAKKEAKIKKENSKRSETPEKADDPDKEVLINKEQQEHKLEQHLNKTQNVKKEEEDKQKDDQKEKQTEEAETVKTKPKSQKSETESSLKKEQGNRKVWEKFSKAKDQKKSVFGSWKEKLRKLIQQIKEFPQKLQTFWKKLCDTVRKILQKKDSLGDKLEQVQSIWKDQSNRAAISYLWSLVKKFLQHIRPRRVKGYIHFGMENPAETGKILGVLAMIYGIIENMPEIQPDFEQKILEGRFLLKGRVQIYVILVLLFKILRDERVHRLRKVIGGLGKS